MPQVLIGLSDSACLVAGYEQNTSGCSLKQVKDSRGKYFKYMFMQITERK